MCSEENNQNEFGDIEGEVKILRAVYPLFLIHLKRLQRNYPPPEPSEDHHQHFTDFEQAFASGDALVYRGMFDSDIHKMVNAGSYTLAYRDVVRDYADALGGLPFGRAEYEYENFLFRAVSLRDKSYQVWNAFNRYPLKPKDVTRPKIQQQITARGTEDKFFSELVAFWDTPLYKEVVLHRNHGAHQHSHDGAGAGYPIVGGQKMLEDKGRKFMGYGIGGRIGAIDWPVVQERIPTVVDLVLSARAVIVGYVG